MYLYKGYLVAAAPALAKANDTAKIALAPNFYLHHPHSFLVPSNSYTIKLSSSFY